MFIPKPRPLQAALDASQALTRINCLSAAADPFYKEMAHPLIALGILPILDCLPPGNYCIAGGAARSVFEGLVPADVDVFMLGSRAQIQDSTAALSLDPSFPDWFPDTKSIKINYGETLTKFITLASTDKLSDLYNIQVISQYYQDKKSNTVFEFKSAEDILETFDLVSSCFAVEVEVTRNPKPDIEVRKIVSHPLFLKCVSTKELMVNDFGDAGFKVMRADRFYKYIAEYGYRIKSEEQMKLFNAMLAKDHSNDDFEYI